MIKIKLIISISHYRKYAFYFYIENLVFPRVAGSKMDQDFLI
jgi:hypothetical protein